jgi:hypothetical protein
MLVLTGGRERSTDEYRQLLGAAGLSLRRIVASPSASSILEATHLVPDAH